MTEESTVSYSRRSAEVDITETLNEEMVHNDFTIGTEITDLLGIYHHPARSATTKTIKMRDRDILATDNTLLASVSGMSTTTTCGDSRRSILPDAFGTQALYRSRRLAVGRQETER